MKKIIQPSQPPVGIMYYSPAVHVGNVVYCSGQLPVNPRTMTVVEGDITQQIDQVFKNLKQVVEAAGGRLDWIVKLTVFLTDISTLSLVNERMSHFFQEPYPARTSIGVASLPKGVGIEVDAIMVLES